MTMEQAVKEYRVWLETGDPIGCASVYKRRAWYTVELDPFYLSEKLRTKGFRSEQAAYDFALEAAERFMAEAIAWEKAEHASKGYQWEEEWENSYSIQTVEAE